MTDHPKFSSFFTIRFGKDSNKVWREASLGKTKLGNKTVLRPVYPKFDDFLSLRKQLDPKNMFLNDYFKKVFMILLTSIFSL